MIDTTAPYGRCAYELCNAPLPAPSNVTGRPRKYCNDARCGARGRFLARIRADARRAGVVAIAV